MAGRPGDPAPPPGLAAFFEELAPLLLGEEDVTRARSRLFPGREDGPDAKRLAIYARFCRNHRHAVLSSVYGDLRRLVLRTRGEEGWAALVEAYFRAHPMFHAELNENGAHLPTFLEAQAEGMGLPLYVAALADLAWWEWRTLVAADDPSDADPDQGPLRLASTVEVRPYAWDLCAWLDREEAGDVIGAPEARQVFVLFWRDQALKARRAEASLLELYVLKAVLAGDARTPTGVHPARWRETLEDLRSIGVLLGG